MAQSGTADIRELHKIAQAETGNVAWLTLLLSAGAFSVFWASFFLSAAGVIPVAAAFAVNAGMLIIAYTGVHEAIHENMHGRRRGFRWLNTVFGHLLIWLFVHSYTLHKWVHLTHHSHTNDPDLDPDCWMSAKSFGAAALRAPLLVFSYFAYGVRRKAGSPEGRRFLLRAALEMAVPVGLLVYFFSIGLGAHAMIVWVGAAIAALSVLAIILDWLPHHPHEGRSRIDGTRMILFRSAPLNTAISWAYLFQNYHLIHHLYPRVPFYRYGRVFRRGEEALVNAGAAIVRI